MHITQDPFLHPQARKNVSLIQGVTNGVLTPETWKMDDAGKAELEMHLYARLATRLGEAVSFGHIEQQVVEENFTAIAERTNRLAMMMCTEACAIVVNLQNPSQETYAAVEAMQLPIAAEMMGIFDAFKKISVGNTLDNTKECLGKAINAVLDETTKHLETPMTGRKLPYVHALPYETLTDKLKERGRDSVDNLWLLMNTRFGDMCNYLPSARHFLAREVDKDALQAGIFALTDTVQTFRQGYRREIVIAATELEQSHGLLLPAKEKMDNDPDTRQQMPKLAETLDAVMDVLGAFVKAQNPGREAVR